MFRFTVWGSVDLGFLILHIWEFRLREKERAGEGEGEEQRERVQSKWRGEATASGLRFSSLSFSMTFVGPFAFLAILCGLAHANLESHNSRALLIFRILRFLTFLQFLAVTVTFREGMWIIFNRHYLLLFPKI